jgi:type I restriction enzyme S subunit
MKQNLKYAPLSKFIDINPENLSKNYPYIEIEYIDISSVASGYLNEKPKTLTLANAPSRAKRIVRENDSILATVRPNLRSFLYITNPKANTIVSTGFAVLRAKNKVDPRFIYYAITNPVFTGYLTNNAKGTSYPAVDTDIILRGEIADFPYITQQKIADILSKYDDLIENNRRRIELLEESARLLYREWFVYLRFPGHEHTPIIDGIPEGWERIPLGETLTLQRGFDLPASQRNPGKYPIYASTGINGYHDKFKVKAPGIVTGRSGSLGTVMYVSEDFWPLNTTLWVKEFKKVDAIFALHLLQSLSLEQYNGGAAVPTLNRNDVHRIEILCPPNKLKSFFYDFASPIYAQVKKLEIYNLQLIKARDILLPRLMNGEIAV